MQDLPALQLGQIEQLTGVLVDGQAATVQTLQQCANRLEEATNRLNVPGMGFAADSKNGD